jgi:hypothetical protein
MNEKDVLVARPAAWNVQKMKSVPHWENTAFVQKARFTLV